MAVHNLIKMKIKQTKMNFFCLHFNLVFSRNSLTTHVLQKYVLEKLTSYWGDVTFCLYRTSDNSSIFAIPLDFEIARLTCCSGEVVKSVFFYYYF